jgi:hypothetical protein
MFTDFIIDMDLNLIQAGSAMHQLIPEIAFPGLKINEVLKVCSSRGGWDLEHLLKFDFTSKVGASSIEYCRSLLATESDLSNHFPRWF